MSMAASTPFFLLSASIIIIFFLCKLWSIDAAAVESAAPGSFRERNLEGTVAFASVGRAHYAFDIFQVELPPEFANGHTDFSSQSASAELLSENLLTDGTSVNYNGQFVSESDLSDSLLSNLCPGNPSSAENGIVFVSERSGSAQIYLDCISASTDSGGVFSSRRAEMEVGSLNRPYKLDTSSMLPLATSKLPVFHDRPSLAGEHVIYVSTQEPADRSRQSWTAIYSTSLVTGSSVRLTPSGVVDFSPAVSPSGKLVAVASYGGGKGWDGEIYDLVTDLYIFNTVDGSNRRLVARRGGWPTWADESTLFFHRLGEDGWWSIYRVSLVLGEAGEERVTPPGIHAFTPAASRTGRWLAVATRQPNSQYRHVEIFNLASKSFIKITEKIAPDGHHYNPFISPDSSRVGYHKCRGSSHELKKLSSKFVVPHLEHIQSPLASLAIVRVDGTFPSFSPDGSLVAFIPNLDEGGVYVTRLNGEGRVKVFSGLVFGLAWDKARKGVIYTSYGEGFTAVDNTVHIVSISNVDRAFSGNTLFSWKRLTKQGTGNNAFPSPSPDGKWLVFRSGRSGYKNLYIMDAVHGEEVSIRRLTEGPWTDTMASWSHDGKWIAFASDRDNPGQGSFAVYFIHPDGTGLHKVLSSSNHAGRVNHPFFSPDSQSLVFTSDIAGVSAEPVSVPHQFQPYGEIFIAKIDGTELQRLTHNAYEDGTPSWGPVFLQSSQLSGDGEVLKCDFDDVNLPKQHNLVSTVNC